MVRKLRKWERGRNVADVALCSGCRTCETVCSLSHENVANPLFARIQFERELLNANQCTVLACAQCGAAPCLAACKKGAISEDSVTNAKVIDAEKCVGCKLCLQACIMSPPRIRLHRDTGKAIKCDLCGGEPQCVQACPMGALRYEEVE